jgi:hypothetical protein
MSILTLEVVTYTKKIILSLPCETKLTGFEGLLNKFERTLLLLISKKNEWIVRIF